MEIDFSTRCHSVDFGLRPFYYFLIFYIVKRKNKMKKKIIPISFVKHITLTQLDVVTAI